MNKLSVAEKRFPRSEQDIAADYFALRKTFTGTKWVFSEGRNSANSASHCDIAWAGALATEAHNRRKGGIGVTVGFDHGVLHCDGAGSPVARMILSDAPRIWKPLV